MFIYLYIVWIVFHVFILIHLLFPLFLQGLSLMKSKRNEMNDEVGMKEIDYAIIVTAYGNVKQIPAVVNSILHLNYDRYLIYIVADNCDSSSLSFDNAKVVILRPEKTLANNVKSHFYAINNFKRDHSHLTIIDSDNLVHPDYLIELNKVFMKGFVAVQGVREAKNLNTDYACLDAANDIYYRYVDKQLLTVAGSSSSLSGSGMAFTTSIYKDCLEGLDTQGAGFDKILQYEIIYRTNKIAFAAEAIVYDEKTSKSDQLVKQRARWINTWFKFFKLGMKMTSMGIGRLNWNQLLFGIMLLRPPLFILLILSVFFFLIDLFLFPLMALAVALSALGFVFVFFKSLSFYKADDLIYQSLKSIHKFIFYQIIALIKAKRANEISVATEHDQDSDIKKLI